MKKQAFTAFHVPLAAEEYSKGSGKFKETHKPEYETVLSLGGLCLNKDVDSIFYLNELLNRAGMDTISAGSTVAFAIECYEKNILTKEDTDGIELSWGNSKAITALIEKMIKREGIGDILADGVKPAAAKIKKGSEKLCFHAGGQELPMHDSRNDAGYAIHYCVEPAPGKHTVGSRLYYEMYQLWKVVSDIPKIPLITFKKNKFLADDLQAEIAATNSKFTNVINGAGACMFGAFLGAKRIRIFDWLNAATGWDYTPNEYMDTGKKIQTLKQAFNIKHGIEPKDFKIGNRVLGNPAQTKGANKNITIDIEKMMADYWEKFGWDPLTGKPLLKERE